jgi:hypothetical protein
MNTHCSTAPAEIQVPDLSLEYENGLGFEALGKRQVVARLDGGTITSDAGGLLLREVDATLRVLDRLTACFTDQRDPDLIEHSVRELLAQRIFALTLGYEDLNDHDTLRRDPLLATLVGKLDPTGAGRPRQRDQGAALAGKSTLNRLELTKADKDRYHKIVHDPAKLADLFVELFLDAYKKPPRAITLDLDTTDDTLHGQQEGIHFDAYYDSHCYTPLYIFADGHLLCARLLTSDLDEAPPALEELKRIVPLIRQRWPKTRLIVRGDSAFSREALMAWCEGEGVDYVLGQAKNSRLNALLAPQMAQAKALFEETKQAARVYGSFQYQTLKSWSRERRVVGKAEHLAGGANPRFVVTTLPTAARRLYEKRYCARGEAAENRIKEQKLDLFSDRTSCHALKANQLRLWLSSFAYTLLAGLRRLGLRGTALARATCGTIRLRLLKVGAQVVVSVRRVLFRLAGGWPLAGAFRVALQNLRCRDEELI